jgi:negative regulator of sigma E activity
VSPTRCQKRFLCGAALGAALAVSVPGGRAQALQDPLREVLARQQNISFEGERLRIVVRNDSLKGRVSNRQLVRHRPVSDYRVDYLDLPEGGESHFLAEGNRIYQWQDDEHIYVSERSDDQTLGLVISPDYLSLLEANYRITRRRGETVAGRTTWNLRINGRNPGRPSIQAWIDTEHGVPLRLERYDQRGELYMQTEYQSIRFGVMLDDGVFQLPDQAELRSTSRGTQYDTPEKLAEKTGLPAPLLLRPPEGFRLDRIIHLVRRDREYVQTFYSDGLATLSVFAESRPDEAPEGSTERVHTVRSGVRGGQVWAQGWIGPVSITLFSDDLAEAELVRSLSSAALATRTPD